MATLLRNQSSFLAAFAGLALALTSGVAEAQGFGWGHRRAPAPSVSDAAPLAGPAGTLVTIRGTGFTQQTSVRVGHRPVRIESLAPNAIRFQMPRVFRRGAAITLRHPGMQDVNVGTFTLRADPHVTSATPSANRRGSQLHIEGSGFLPGDAVLLNGTSLSVLRLTESRIVAALPANARSGVLSLVRASSGQRWNTGVRVDLTPAPQITSMSARPMPNGIEITIIGSGFGPDARVTVSNSQARILSSSPTRIVALLPPRALADAPAVVHTAGRSLSTAIPVRRSVRA